MNRAFRENHKTRRLFGFPFSQWNHPESLLDHSDLVFINPVGTGYSSAVAPSKDGNFWGVDEDARSISQFIKRYLTVFQRWNSPRKRDSIACFAWDLRFSPWAFHF